MGKSRKVAGGVSGAITRALSAIALHPYVLRVGETIKDAKTGLVAVNVDMHVDLPNRYVIAGKTPSGVHAVESVTLLFPNAFPLQAPVALLRKDFDRSLAHVQPSTIADRPIPCLFDGSLTELLQRDGILGVVEQLAEWLNRAALGTLINPHHGWEPVRRDTVDDRIVCDADWIRAQVGKKPQGFLMMPFGYHRLSFENPNSVFFYGTIRSAGQIVDNSSTAQFFKATEREQGRERGDSIALLVWNREDDQGNPRVVDKYLPETVDTVAGLIERAKLYGVEAQLQEGLTCLRTALAGQKWKWPSPVPIIFAVPRPFNLIGQDSSIELTSYLVEIDPPELFNDEKTHPVRIASQRDMVRVPLLRRMSGDDKKAPTPEWVLVGAGSLGSKIALHLARSGRAPRAIIDSARLSPHNAARHALYPARQADWLDQKAEAVSEAITGLGQSTWPIPEDVGPILRETSRARALFSKRTWATVNATASLAVREAFAAADPHLVRARTIETGLFGRGMIGYIAIEGAERNPNCLDLMAEFYRMTGGDSDVASAVHNLDTSLERLNIGDGCGSVTMPMSDAQLSTFAGAISSYIIELQRTGLPVPNGRICIGSLDADRLNLKWRVSDIPPCEAVRTPGPEAWTVSVSQRVANLIAEEVGRWPSVETGGILMGRYSEASRQFQVVDLLPAPEDSTRSAAEFVLGKKGVRRALKDFRSRYRDSLYCLGTWHSHLHDSGPSQTDILTAAAIAISQIPPALSLIRTPINLRALVALRMGQT